jgi:hypothetical protein
VSLGQQPGLGRLRRQLLRTAVHKPGREVRRVLYGRSPIRPRLALTHWPVAVRPSPIVCTTDSKIAAAALRLIAVRLVIGTIGNDSRDLN